MAEKTGKPKVKGPEEMARLIREDGRYPLEAFEFLHDALENAAQKVHGEGPAEPGQRHVTGAQLCQALRAVAIERWGPLAKTVLRRWRIRSTLDFGNMVYLLVNNEFMQKTPQDSLEDFRDVYSFDKAFRVKPAFEVKE
jgi:uncharacterized repeat protein (TIGR04138 family)